MNCYGCAERLEKTSPEPTSTTRWWHESISSGAYDGLCVRRARLRKLQRSPPAAAARRAAELPLVPPHHQSRFARHGLPRRPWELGASIQRSRRAPPAQGRGGIRGPRARGFGRARRRHHARRIRFAQQPDGRGALRLHGSHRLRPSSRPAQGNHHHGRTIVRRDGGWICAGGLRFDSRALPLREGRHARALLD